MLSPRHVALALVFAATSIHCASTDPTPVDSTPAPAASAQWEPVAGYLGSDDVTGAKIVTLMNENHIEWSAGGSLGYTVNVPARDAARAREILRTAIAEKKLDQVTIYEAQDLQTR